MSVINNYNYNEKVYEIINRWKILSKSLKSNYLLTTCIIIQVLALSILYPSNPQICIFGNIIFGFITFVISIVVGYYVHVYSHLIDFDEIYQYLYNSPNFVGRFFRKMPKPIKWAIDKFVYLLDFHDKIHHNTNINKQWQNVLIEMLMNIYTEGVALIILFKILNFGIQIRDNIFKFNYPILFAWSILYATIHNVNYNIINPICHIQHHINNKTNYGIDFMDILFGSKYDELHEEMNHASLNVILILLFIIFIKDYWNPEKENGVSKYLYNFVNWFVSY